jgi:hypothetical protein
MLKQNIFGRAGITVQLPAPPNTVTKAPDWYKEKKK